MEFDVSKLVWTRAPQHFEITPERIEIETVPHTDLWQRTYLDSENWLKGSIEYENERFAHLGSVVTNHGYSDWATTEIPATIKSMWYRLSRRADDFRIECSEDGVTFKQMRVCHLHAAQGPVPFGVYACSPEDSSFTAVFTNMALLPCTWQAHDGQQPDEV